MRFKLIFELENTKLDVQYRKSILSWIKNSIQEYDEELYQQMYHAKDPIKKSFCFAPILPQPAFSKEEVALSNASFQIIFSIYNYVYALHMYNAFHSQRNHKFSLNKNSMTLKKIVKLPEQKIVTDHISVKMISPIICRNHNKETKKDLYYAFNKEEFKQYIKINIEEQMKQEGLEKSLLDEFEIIPIQAKKTVIPLYEKMIECSIGTFSLKGDKRLLNYIYQAGIGSKKAMGFGLMEIW